MTPPDTWTPLPETVDYIARWYAWATNGAPDGEPFWRSFGLCTSINSKLDADLLKVFRGSHAPFGEAEYFSRSKAQTQHECPNRLAFCRAVLVRAGREI